MAYGLVPIVHIVAVVFAIIELGLTGYLVSSFTSPWGARAPDILNFMLFNSIWSLLVLAYVGLTPLYFARIFHHLAALALEAVAMLFWFAGSIALAADVRGSICGPDRWCGTVQAAVAFGFFLWALFAALVVLDALDTLRSRGKTGSHHKPAAYSGA